MDKKQLYEHIMSHIAKEVKKALNEQKVFNEFEELTDKYMPDEGNADTLAGELLRAVNRIEYRYFNDGDMAGEGYGKETVNPAVRFLFANVDLRKCEQLLARAVHYLMDCVNRGYVSNSDEYEHILNNLKVSISNYIYTNQLWNMPNNEDMLAYRDKDEDVDDSWDNEDDWDDNDY